MVGLQHLLYFVIFYKHKYRPRYKVGVNDTNFRRNKYILFLIIKNQLDSLFNYQVSIYVKIISKKM